MGPPNHDLATYLTTAATHFQPKDKPRKNQYHATHVYSVVSETLERDTQGNNNKTKRHYFCRDGYLRSEMVKSQLAWLKK